MKIVTERIAYCIESVTVYFVRNFTCRTTPYERSAHTCRHERITHATLRKITKFLVWEALNEAFRGQPNEHVGVDYKYEQTKR